MKKRSITGFLAFFTLLALTFSFTTSCGIILLDRDGDTTDHPYREESTDTGHTDIVRVEKPGSEEDITNAVNSLSDADFGGVAFMIATVDTGYSSYFPESGSDAINAARLKINSVVEKKYNTAIMNVKSASEEAMVEELRKASSAELYYADLLSFPVNKLGFYISSDVLMNMNSIPYIDYSAECFNTDAIDQMSAGYKIYAVAGAATEDPRFRYLVCYNKSLVADLGLEDPYDIVTRGEWTWDKFREMTIQVRDASATDEAGDKIWGAVSDEYYETFSDIVRTCYQLQYVDCGVGHVPELSVDPDMLDLVADFCRNMIYIDDAYLECLGEDVDSYTRYGRKGSLFWIGMLNDVQPLAAQGEYVSVLPLPTKEEGGEVVAYTNPSLTTVLSAPKDIATLDNISLFLLAYNTAAYQFLNNSAVVHMAYNSVSENRSLNLLDDILSIEPTYDFAVMVSSESEAIANATVEALYYGVQTRFTASGYHLNYVNSAKYQFARLFGEKNT